MVLVWFVCVYGCCRFAVLGLGFSDVSVCLIVLVVMILIVLLCSDYGYLRGF